MATLRQVMTDPNFHALPLAAQSEVMRRIGATDDQVSGWVAKVSGATGVPVLRPQAEPEGMLDRAREWLTGSASDKRITERESAELGDVGRNPGWADLGEAALAGVGAGLAPLAPVAAISAPVPTGLALLTGALGSKLGGELGEMTGEEIGPGVGETYGRPAGEMVGGVVGGVGGAAATAPLGRVVQRAGRGLYKMGLNTPPKATVGAAEPLAEPIEGWPTTVRAVPVTKELMLEELESAGRNRLVPRKSLPVRASAVNQAARDAAVQARIRLMDRIQPLVDDPALAEPAAQAIRGLIASPPEGLLQASSVVRAVSPLLTALEKGGNVAAAQDLRNEAFRHIRVLDAVNATNWRTRLNLAYLPSGITAYALGTPQGATVATATAAAQQPLLQRAVGAGLMRAGREAEREGSLVNMAEFLARLRGGAGGTAAAEGESRLMSQARQLADEGAPSETPALQDVVNRMTAEGRLTSHEVPRRPAAAPSAAPVEAVPPTGGSVIQQANSAAKTFGLKSGEKVFYISLNGEPLAFFRNSSEAQNTLRTFASSQGWQGVAGKDVFKLPGGGEATVSWARALAVE